MLKLEYNIYIATDCSKQIMIKLTRKQRYKTIAITNLGAVIEWFEFSLYGYLATYISILFFPEEDRTVALISVFGVFAASYIMRPLGGFFFGSLGDRFGRRFAIKLSMLVMCIPMLIMSIMPTYNFAGIIAIFILVFARMLQGFSVGGEYTGVLIALAEGSSPKSWNCCLKSAISFKTATLASAHAHGVSKLLTSMSAGSLPQEPNIAPSANTITNFFIIFCF